MFFGVFLTSSNTDMISQQYAIYTKAQINDNEFCRHAAYAFHSQAVAIVQQMQFTPAFCQRLQVFCSDF